jgi:site-specific recombinase XerD
MKGLYTVYVAVGGAVVKIFDNVVLAFMLLLQIPDTERLRGKRERAPLALVLACGLRRHEAVSLTLDRIVKN